MSQFADSVINWTDEQILDAYKAGSLEEQQEYQAELRLLKSELEKLKVVEGDDDGLYYETWTFVNRVIDIIEDYEMKKEN